MIALNLPITIWLHDGAIPGYIFKIVNTESKEKAYRFALSAML